MQNHSIIRVGLVRGYAMPNEQTDLSSYDTTERIDRVDHGFRLTVDSTRGTGTRDQDSVKAEARTETLAELEDKRPKIRAAVIETMNELRENQPDEHGDE